VWRRLFEDFFKTKMFKSSAYIIIDRLDRADEDELQTFLRLLKVFNKDEAGGPKIQFSFLTTLAIDLETAMEDILDIPIPFINLSSGRRQGDIKQYVEFKVSKARKLRKIPPALRAEILSKLTNDAGDSF